jgi:uncharacterized protein YlxW (UPF0749 family)
MGRPRKARKQAVSLFPFLDILACVIGNLILIITTVVLEQVDTKPVAEAARIDDLAEEAKRQAAKAADLQKQVDELRQRSGVASDKLEEIRAKIAAAKQQLKEAEAKAREASQPVAPPPEMAAELAKLEEERKKIEAEIKELEGQIAERRKPPEQMIAILPPGEGGGPRKGDPDAIVTFLVRSDGLSSLVAGQKAAAAAGARSGRVPLPGDGALDLSGTK